MCTRNQYFTAFMRHWWLKINEHILVLKNNVYYTFLKLRKQFHRITHCTVVWNQLWVMTLNYESIISHERSALDAVLNLWRENKSNSKTLTVNFLVIFIHDPLQIQTTAPDGLEQFEFGVKFRVWRHHKLVVLFAQLFAHLLFSHPILMLHFGHRRSVGVVLPTVQPWRVIRVPANFNNVPFIYTRFLPCGRFKNLKTF